MQLVTIHGEECTLRGCPGNYVVADSTGVLLPRAHSRFLALAQAAAVLFQRAPCVA
jgi:regulator of RNase E activity RraA